MVLHLTSSTGRAEQRAGDVEFVDLARHLGAGREVDRGMHADHDRDFEIAAARRAALQVLPDVAARMQARAEAVRPFELQALVAQIAHAGIGILAHEDAGADVAAGVLLEMPADRQQPASSSSPCMTTSCTGPSTHDAAAIMWRARASRRR